MTTTETAAALDQFRSGYARLVAGERPSGLFGHLGAQCARRDRRDGIERDLDSLSHIEMCMEIAERFVVSLTDHWKGPCEATVPTQLAGFVREAMNNQGSIVDVDESRGRNVYLYSEGYWTHGF